MAKERRFEYDCPYKKCANSSADDTALDDTALLVFDVPDVSLHSPDVLSFPFPDMQKFLILFLFLCAETTSIAQLLPTPSAQPLACPCASTNATSVQGRGRGVAAYIVVRGQRFGGSFGDPIGAGRGYDSGRGGGIPFFPNPVNSPELGGGISPQTARQYATMLGPFKAGVPTVATIIAEIVDEFGYLVTNATQSTSALFWVAGNLQQPSGGGQNSSEMRIDASIPEVSALPLRSYPAFALSRNGRFEWNNLTLSGIASTTITLTLSDKSDLIPRNFTKIFSTLAICHCPVSVTLQGGFPFGATIATQAVNLDSSLNIYPGEQGPFAFPGNIAGRIEDWNLTRGSGRLVGGYDGSVTSIVIGEKVRFPHKGKGTYPATAVTLRDRFGNMASLSTTVTLSLNCPPYFDDINPQQLTGNTVQSTLAWGQGYLGQEQLFSTAASLAQVASNVALFPDFIVTGSTSNFCSLAVFTSRCGDPYIYGNQFDTGCGKCTFSFYSLNPATIMQKNTSEAHCSPRVSSAIVSILPSRAVAIAPVMMPDPYNRNELNRMPSQMLIGQSNAADPKTWFYAQAVDEFGNRVDRGPHAYNGGEARISFAAPEDGFPRTSDGAFQFTSTNASVWRDPFTKANTQQHSARGTTARAVNGLYTFNNFTPLGMTSRTNADVVLTFDDTALKGIRAPINTGGGRPLFQPLPPITTATTTFLLPTSFRIHQANTGSSGGIILAPNPVQTGEEQVTMRFFVAEPMMVRVEVYSLHGARLLASEKRYAAGEVLEVLSLRGFAAGAYFVRVCMGGVRAETTILTIMR